MIQHSVLKTAILVSAVWLSLAISAEDDAIGQALYTSCASCHGQSGSGLRAMNAPSIAGMTSDYLSRQLKHFKSGLRGSEAGDTLGAQMKAMTNTLANDQAIDDVSSYISAMPITGQSAQIAGDLRRGNNLYQGNCGSCHGGKGEGNPRLNTPRLAHQDAAYLTRQFNNFKAGLRGKHPEDRFGRQMKMMANMLDSPQDLQDIIAYLQAQNSSGNSP